jgi:hypothetical protein
MKSKKTIILSLFILFLSGTFSCINASNDFRPQDTVNEKIRVSQEDGMQKLVLKVKVISNMAIGWGLTSKCRILSVEEGSLPKNDSTIIIYISVGNRYYSYENPVLEPDKSYTITFFQYIKTEKTYLSAGTTGFMDTDGYVWLINTIENTN